MFTPEHIEELKQLFFNILVFRLGGQVDFTAEDIEYAGKTIQKTRILLVKCEDKDEYKFVLKTVLA